MILNDRERLIFITYCKQMAESSLAIADQLKGSPIAAHKMLAEMELNKSRAYQIVANDLGRIESFTVSKGESGEIDDAQDTGSEGGASN